MKSRLLVLATNLSAIILVACGGNDDATDSRSTGTSPASLTAASIDTPTVSPIGGAAATDPVTRSGDVLAYVDDRWALWIANADGGDRRKIADQCGGFPVWSPVGDRIACSYFDLVVYDLDGTELLNRSDVGPWPIFWSPDNHRIAYRGADGSLRVADVDSNEALDFHPNGVPLVWLDRDVLLAGFDVDDAQEFSARYSAHFLNLATGESAPAPYFDNGKGFWLFPDRARALIPGDPWAVYEFATESEVGLPDFTAGGGSEGTSIRSVSVSCDGTLIYGVSWAEQSTIRRIRADGSDLVILGSRPGALVALSQGGKVAWLAPGDYFEELTITDLEAGTDIGLGRATPHMSWRPCILPP